MKRILNSLFLGGLLAVLPASSVLARQSTKAPADPQAKTSQTSTHSRHHHRSTTSRHHRHHKTSSKH